MQVRAFQNTWHQIDLCALTKEHQSEPANPAVYTRFYEALNAGAGNIRESWKTSKRALGNFIASKVFCGWQAKAERRPRILALCVGTCVAEGVWLEQEYEVTLHECQAVSLEQVRIAFPSVPVLIQDIRELAAGLQFDIVTLLASEYFLDRHELVRVLEKIASLLAKDGLLVVHSVSALSLLQAAKEAVKKAVKKATPRYRQRGDVFWGYWRSPREFVRCAEKAGFFLDSSYAIEFADGRIAVEPRHSLIASWPTLTCNSLLMVYKPELSY